MPTKKDAKPIRTRDRGAHHQRRWPLVSWLTLTLSWYGFLPSLTRPRPTPGPPARWLLFCVSAVCMGRRSRNP